MTECVVNSDCVDNEGGYSCPCRPGFTGNGNVLCTGIHHLSHCVYDEVEK